MEQPVILSAARTAIGRFGGGLSSVPAHQLGSVAIKAALERCGVAPEDVEEVILGQVLTAGQGQNPARQAAIAAGIPVEHTAFGVNQVCGSGLRAVMLAAQQVMTGQARLMVAGGQENMSLAPHIAHLRNGTRFGDTQLVDTMIRDGLWDVFNGYHMGITAENVASAHGISRERQDLFALESHSRAARAMQAGVFREEIASVFLPGRHGTVEVNADEHIRPDTTLEALAALRPGFSETGTVTAGNASGINDGAAALVIASAAEASRRGLLPLARIVSFASAGVDPAMMGLGPVPASRKALDLAGWSVADLDLIEGNEAFAAQACAVNALMGWDTARVNVNGGSIALGHPIGASGARVLVTLLHEMQRRQVRRGLATLCIGGGMGVAMCIERLHS
ncbi:acetyl-CoA C-acetyltransferase [Granulibacter bethesdensis]|uniref:acetyl-CoA C-acetyltransferase n=1 Tax=Granulibacter bethesdensis TaxID=364410 RepID=UPI0003F1CCA2|nr:acetyl-CoA C-acetyltransferase [Granulibacter bethesdensis]AHJ64842.1 Acetyl-CoA acetyltransferase [Granulibacter bethesdensis CGDNIH4]